MDGRSVTSIGVVEVDEARGQPPPDFPILRQWKSPLQLSSEMMILRGGDHLLT